MRAKVTFTAPSAVVNWCNCIAQRHCEWPLCAANRHQHQPTHGTDARGTRWAATASDTSRWPHFKMRVRGGSIVAMGFVMMMVVMMAQIHSHPELNTARRTTRGVQLQLPPAALLVLGGGICVE